MKIIFVRHGDPNYEKDCLTEKGQWEASMCAKRTAAFDAQVTAYYMSPLGRAVETAEFSLKPLGKEATVLPWIREFTGKAVDPSQGILRHGWDYFPRDWMEDPVNYDRDNWWNSEIYRGTNCEEAYKIITDGLDGLLKEYGYTRKGGVGHSYLTTEDTKRDVTIVIFCHMIATFSCMSHLTGIAMPVFAHGFFCPPTGWSLVETEERVPGEASFRIRSIGDVRHLEQEDGKNSDAGFFPGVEGIR